MSDFLTHLVQRALSPTAEVRPRFPSRFETEQPHPPIADANFANEEESPPRAAAQTATRFAAAPENSTAPTPRNPRDPSARDWVAPPIDAAPSQFASRVESVVQIPTTPRDSSGDSAGGWAENLARGNQPAPTRAASAGEFATALATEDTLRAAPTANRSSTPPNPTRAELGSILPPSTEPLLHAAAARPAAFAPPSSPPSARKPLEIHATKSPAPRRAQSAADLAPAPRVASVATVAPAAEATVPPPIHVTIGRIEIRATTPPAPARPASATPARMGLDDYLHRTSGGRR